MKTLKISTLIFLITMNLFIVGLLQGSAITCYAGEDIHFASNEELMAAYKAYLQSKGGNIIGDAGARFAYDVTRMENFLNSPENTTGYQNLEQVRTIGRWGRTMLEGEDSTSPGTLFAVITNPSLFHNYTTWLIQNKFLGDYIRLNNETGMLEDTRGNNNESNIYSGINVSDSGGRGANVWIVSNKGAWNKDATIDAYGSYYRLTPGDAKTNAIYNRENTSYTRAKWSVNFGQTNSAKQYVYTQWESDNKDQLLWEVYCETQSGGTAGYFFTDFKSQFPTQNRVEEWGYPIIYKRYSNDTNNYLGFYRHRNDGISYVNDIFDGVFFTDSELQNNTVNASYTDVDINFDINTTYNNNITNYPDINATGNLYLQPRVKVNGKYQPINVNADADINATVKNYYNDSGTKDTTQTIPSDKEIKPDNSEPSLPPYNPPTGGDTSGGTIGGEGTDGTINLPDFNFSLPDIDWKIDGLKEKFPFSIPFDLYAMYKVLDAEPETPVIRGHLDLKLVDWQFEYDLHQFDDIARITRNIEFVGFAIGLILITRRLIKG